MRNTPQLGVKHSGLKWCQIWVRYGYTDVHINCNCLPPFERHARSSTLVMI